MASARLNTELLKLLNKELIMYYVGVKFSSNSKEYVYGSKEKLDEGDIVLVYTGRVSDKEVMTYDYFAIAVVTNTNVKSDNATKCIVHKVDINKYINDMNELNSIRELKAKMDARIEKLKQGEIYKEYAKIDSELAELLNEYNNLNGNKESKEK